jgi:putative molybdopterin biosynthesis protein
MSIYLHDIPLVDAQANFKKALLEKDLWGILGKEKFDLDEKACGRVTAEPIWALISSPHYHASAMDGFAVRAEETTHATATRPVILEIGKSAVYVDTGDPLPGWANAVAPIETIEALDQNLTMHANQRHPYAIRLRAGLTPWIHVRPMGEDIVASQLILPAGHTLKPADLGAVAASGHTCVKVSRLPRVAVIPTGTELIPVGKEIHPGDIIEFNSIVLSAQINSWGGIANRFPIIPDDFDKICQTVKEAAATHDLILLNAGSSAGSEDYSSRVVETLGDLLVHGVAVRPGHPVILGMINLPGNEPGSADRHVPIIGIPGYPVSAALTAEIFVEPLLSLWLGRPSQKPIEVTASLTRKITSPAGDDDYVRVVVGQVADRLLATPLSRGAGVITSLVRADGICILPSGVQGLEAGSPVKVRLYRHPADLDHVIFAIGSHDMTLDLVSQFLVDHDRILTSANVGSLGGLVALRRQEAHLAGSHLLDPVTGEYNIGYIHQYLPDTPVRLITWVGREQGLIVQKGNPKGIKSLLDLVRPDVSYVNRQRGAGTRVLLDYHLQKDGLDNRVIHGYTQEEYTHLAVAAAVASNRADCGLAITAAAQALDQDFIPLFQERYDLVIPLQFAESELLKPLYDLMFDEKFRKAITALPGYDVSHMGEVVITASS